MKEIYTSCYSIQDVIHIPSFCIASLLCSGGHFSNIALIDAETKYKSSYLFWGRLRDVLFRVGSTHPDLI